MEAPAREVKEGGEGDKGEERGVSVGVCVCVGMNNDE